MALSLGWGIAFADPYVHDLTIKHNDKRALFEVEVVVGNKGQRQQPPIYTTLQLWDEDARRWKTLRTWRFDNPISNGVRKYFSHRIWLSEGRDHPKENRLLDPKLQGLLDSKKFKLKATTKAGKRNARDGHKNKTKPHSLEKAFP